MLQKIRDRAQGWFAYTIVGILTVPFAIWGIDSYFDGGGALDAAQVGDSKISLQEYQSAYQQQRQRLQAALGDQFKAELLEGPRLKQDVLRQLVDERILSQLTSQQKMRVGDLQLRHALLELPVFQQSGGFNKELYERLLRAQGYTPTMFEEGLRQSLATEQLRSGVIQSALTTSLELDQLIALLKQQRELYFLTLPLQKYTAKAQVADPAIADYYNKNKDQLVNPERVRIQFVEFKLADTAATSSPSEDELKAAYEAQLDKYGQLEQRSATHILVKVPSGAAAPEIEQAQLKAQQLADAIHAGTKTFDQALAEAQADTSGAMEGGDLGVVSKGIFESPALENALYALDKVAAISQPVRMPSGFHILRLDAIKPAQGKPFAEVRDSIAQELRQQQAENRFYEITQTLANLGYEHPDSLDAVAKALSVSIQDSDWFTRQGGADITQQPKVLESAFSEDVLKRGLNSAPLELEPGHVVMLRIKEHQEPTPRTLEEARQEIANNLRESQAREALAKDLATLKTRAAQGENLQVLAKELGGEFKNAGWVERDAAGLDRAILATAFRLAQPGAGQIALGSAALANGDQVLLAVSGVKPGAQDALSQDERKMLAQQLAQQVGNTQFDSLLTSIRAKTKVVMHSDRL